MAFVLGASAAASTALLAQEQRYAALAQSQQWEFLDAWCTECHNLDDYSGGLDMTTLGVADVPTDAAVWEKAIRKLNSGMRKQPSECVDC